MVGATIGNPCIRADGYLLCGFQQTHCLCFTSTKWKLKINEDERRKPKKILEEWRWRWDQFKGEVKIEKSQVINKDKYEGLTPTCDL